MLFQSRPSLPVCLKLQLSLSADSSKHEKARHRQIETIHMREQDRLLETAQLCAKMAKMTPRPKTSIEWEY